MSAPILVTGGAGFMGSWVVRGLVERGESVRIFELPHAAWSRLPLDQIAIVRGDIRDRAAVAQALHGCRAVVHLAGLPQLWVRQRGLYRQINYHGAVHVLDEAVRAGCQRILHVSSATIWPLNNEPICPWDQALGAYCRSKLLAERHALQLARAGAPLVIVSPMAPVGPGDWSRTPPTQLLLDFCLGKRREFLDTQFNLIDVRDAAAGMIGALDHGAPGRRYLLGSATLSLRALFERLAPIAGQPAPRRRVPYAAALLAGIILEWWANVVTGQTPAACIDAVRLTRRALPDDAAADLRSLGVMPRPLNQTLAETVRWFWEVGWLTRGDGAA